MCYNVLTNLSSRKGNLMNIFGMFFAKKLKEAREEGIEKGKKEGVVIGKNEINEERKNESIKSQMFEVSQFIEKTPVIILNNEWCNPVIGDIKSVIYDKGLLYEVYDYLSGEKLFGSSTVMPFTMQKLRAIDKLTPDEIVALFFEGKDSDKIVGKNKHPSGIDEIHHRTGFDDWIKRLDSNGFFTKHNQFKQY